MIHTKPNWKNLKGVEAWLPELKQLLSEANTAAAQPDPKVRLNVAQFLAGFIQESWPQSPEMDKLDNLAEETVTALMMGDISERLGAVAARTAAYAKLAKDMETLAEVNESAADSIRFKRIQQLIEATTETIESAKVLAASLDTSNAGDEKIATLVEETIAAVEKLRSRVARLI